MKKHTIKFASMLIAFTVFLSGCAQTAVTTLNGAYFLQNAGNISVIGNIDEFNQYNVTFEKSSDSAAKSVQIALYEEEGFNTYTTHLTNSSYEGEDCYKLETVLKTKISYIVYDEYIGVYEDYINSVVYFGSVANRLKPLFSSVTASAHSPVTDSSGTYSVTHLQYSYTTTYEGSTAKVDFTPIKGEFGIASGVREYTKLDKANYYFDNVTMLFMPRSIKLTDSSSLSFSVIDALAGVNRSMQLSTDTTKPNEDIIFSTTNQSEGVIPSVYYINNQRLFVNEDSQVIPCFVVNFAVTGTFSGSAIKCWYANTSLEGARARLIKMQTYAPYSLGVFTYTIDKTTITG